MGCWILDDLGIPKNPTFGESIVTNSGAQFGEIAAKAAPDVDLITILGCSSCSTVNADRRSLAGDVRGGASSAAGRPVEVRGLDTKGTIKLGPKSGAIKSAEFGLGPGALVPAPGDVPRPNLRRKADPEVPP